MLPTTKIEVEEGLVLSKVFADHWQEIKQTRRDYIKIAATSSKDIRRTQSFFGYYPFLPVDTSYPVDEFGKLMFPLAQINFSEMPMLRSYPEKGILQFFISTFDLYGLDIENPDVQKNFCVRYYEDIVGLNTVDDMTFIDVVFDMGYGLSPLSDAHELSFSLQHEYVGIYDLWHQEGFAKEVRKWIEANPEHERELVDEASEKFSTHGHKIGGYPDFTQTDPREWSEKFKDYILLFQMGGDAEIMWGDAGVGNFFIHPTDLQKRDFSKVLYNWDCG